jgi:hypothetical protein
MTQVERELGWNDQIQNDGEAFTLLPEGTYPFTVKGFERARHTGSDKLPPCNKAVVKCEIDGGDLGKTTINNNLFLHSKCEGLLCAFFLALGMRKHGEPLQMDWNAIAGKRGRCKVGIRRYLKKDGVASNPDDWREANEIKSFLEPDNSVAVSEVAEDDLPF